ncbi:MAG: hypothetical protein QXJ18_04560 [Desulfurococcaceae archaeon]
MDRVAVFALVLLAGYATRVLLEAVLKSSLYYRMLVDILVKLVYYVLIPLAFVSIFITRGVMLTDVYVFLYYVLFVIVTYFSVKRIKRENYMSLFLTSAFMNSVFLGFPVVEVLFGRVNIAALFGVTTVVLNVVVPDLIVSKRAPIRAIISSTGFLGFLAGVLGFYTLGDVALRIHELIKWSSPLLSYTATYTMGLRIPIKLSYTSEVREMLFISSIYRYLLAPLLALVFVLVLDMNLVDKAEFVVISLMPPAVLNALIAEKYGWNSQLVALTIALLTVFFLVLIFPVLVVAVKLLVYT